MDLGDLVCVAILVALFYIPLRFTPKEQWYCS